MRSVAGWMVLVAAGFATGCGRTAAVPPTPAVEPLPIDSLRQAPPATGPVAVRDDGGPRATPAPIPATPPPARDVPVIDTLVDDTAAVEAPLDASSTDSSSARVPMPVRWSADVTVTGRGRAVAVAATWTVVTPDSAIIESRPTDASDGAPRRVILAGARGWAIEAGVRRPLLDPLLRAEREDLWLWQLVRAAPAVPAGCTADRVRATSGAERVLVARCPGRPTATLHLAAGARLSRIEADLLDPVREVTRHVVFALEGRLSGGTWPETVRIAHDGAPFATVRMRQGAAPVRVDRGAFRP